MTDLPELPSELVEALVAGFWTKPDDNSLGSRLSSALRAALAARGPSGRLLYLASELEQVGLYCEGEHEHPATCPDEQPVGRMVRGLSFVDSPDACPSGVPVFRLPQDQP